MTAQPDYKQRFQDSVDEAEARLREAREALAAGEFLTAYDAAVSFGAACVDAWAARMEALREALS